MLKKCINIIGLVTILKNKLWENDKKNKNKKRKRMHIITLSLREDDQVHIITLSFMHTITHYYRL